MGKGADAGAGLRRSSNTLAKKYTWDEINKHRTPDDAWMVYRNKVYDVSNYTDHPGGLVIFTHAGDDMTDAFAAFHPMAAYKTMEKFCIGELDLAKSSPHLQKSESQAKFEKAYRDLRVQFKKAGLFNASPVYYIWKCLSTLALCGVSWALVLNSDDFNVHLVGALFLALFWQQCGWLAHDFLHHQVFENRRLGDLAGVMIGNIWQGFDVSWWKNKHNSHHSVPNLYESSPAAQDGDPDIDTMPLLAWSYRMAKTADSKLAKWFVAHQAFCYFPILGLARLSWLEGSFSFVFPNPFAWETKNLQMAKKLVANLWLERIGLLIHYAWVGALCAQTGSLTRAITFFLVATCTSGLMLAVVFGLGHNGMSLYEANKRPDFWKLQVSTTRNITGNPFVHWFCGGLQYQVEHHLWPSLPRHSLPKANEIVRSFCKEHGVSYHEASMWQGTCEILSCLSHVTEEFLEGPMM
uniref:Cytochrome b5 heme-binding domain-containing protein n=1 Tax=Phaeomonas parva TaxID=124430 RepID=A0A7S1UKH0_9STRA|mmetsp:Transcript_9771/g.28691  ORF Transcript_9771/g.28691 Transcript_9771/m.28691 type:complete len:465 (+) Transcript_9771:116-1510(+)